MELRSSGKFSRMIKERIIREYLSESISAQMISEEYGMSRSALNHMISRHKEKFITTFESTPILPPMKSKTDLEEKYKKINEENQELRKKLDQAQLKLEGFELMSDILQHQYGVDLLKKSKPNSFQPQSASPGNRTTYYL